MNTNTIVRENNLGYIRATVLGISQEKLARQVGFSRQLISDYELGNRIPSLKHALVLSNALKCSVNDIFKLDGIQSNPS